MNNLPTRLKRTASLLAIIALVCLNISTSYAQTPPNLGTAATYGAFSGAGAIGNTGLTVVNGDIGTYVGSFTGFPPGQYTGAKHVADAAALSAKNDLTTGYNSMNDAVHAVIFDTALNATMGNGQVLTPRTYGRGDLTTLSGNLTFDAKGNPAAVFIIKIRAALNVAANTHILLANGALAANIYWAVDGAVSILDNSIIKGTIVANGAIHMYGGSSLEGRALAVVGAVTLASNIVTKPGSAPPASLLIVITPAPGDTVKGGTQNYQIKWGGSGIASMKTIEYSLDSGANWHLIGTLTADVFTYNWNVPDTASTRALVRVTDQNNLRGVSGLFTIASSKPPASLVVVHPALGEIVIGGTQNYQITWSGNGLASQKTFDYSLDSGLTWKTIGILTADTFTYSWNVPDTSSLRAMVRITDKNGITGKSGLFTIQHSKPNPGSIVVTHPAGGESIDGGTQNYQITFVAVNVTPQKTFEYSIDGGANWVLIGFLNSDALAFSWPNVPNVATSQALVRITDAKGVVGVSGLFTIKKLPGVGSIDSVILSGLDSKSNIGNSKTLGIHWAYTPDIGTTVEIEYSLDGTVTWGHIATVQVSESQNSSWVTVPTGYYNPVFIRVTSSKGMTGRSLPFSIGTPAAVSPQASNNGYSVSNYPNPASNKMVINLISPVSGDVTVTINDALGREVGTVIARHYDAGSFNIPINTSNLAAGMYSYSLQAGSTRLVGRMSIIR